MRTLATRNTKTRKTHKSHRTSKWRKSPKSPKSPKSRKSVKTRKTPTPSPEPEPTMRVNMRQILISVPIEKSVKEYDNSVDTSVFKKSNLPQGFGLSRMENMMSLEFARLLKKEPVQLQPAKNSAGKPVGIRIEGKMMPMYEIVNGRHRVARAIVERMETIPAEIITE